ncbi:hypothetical protein L484_026604 [Morus notabilis]|uniref:Uncharacterized protein n=1 Tax=Morus notabilis TaxID=981085 RepID=W9SMT5_9ROSA|nr:hypothetical protein L484_026604 [Morus notabilis]
MGTSPSSWFKLVAFRIRNFGKRSPRDIIVVYDNTTPASQQDQAIANNIPTEDDDNDDDDDDEETANLIGPTLTQLQASSTLQERILTKEDTAATKIQALFRAHLLWLLTMAYDGFEISTGKTCVSGAEESGEAASYGSRSACEETGAHSSALHACISPAAGKVSSPGIPNDKPVPTKTIVAKGTVIHQWKMLHWRSQ